jgi:hypothetical protein
LVPGVAAVLLLAVACGSSGRAPNVSVQDLAAIAEPPPPLPTGAYRQDNVDDPNAFSLAYLRTHSQTASERAAISVLADAGFERGYQKAWAGEIGDDGGSAQVIVFLFRDSSGMSKARVR